MPRKNGHLTRQEAIFAKNYASTQDVAYSGAQAGLARSSSFEALRRPAIQQAVLAEQLAYMANTLLPLAVKRIENLIINPATPANAALGAAKFVIERSLGDKAEGGKEPHEMTGDELQNAIDRLRREAVDRAKPVIDAGNAQSAPNVLD